MLSSIVRLSSRRTFATSPQLKKIVPEAIQTTPGKMDGDSSANTMDKGANSAMPHVDMTTGIHENSKTGSMPAGEKTQGTGTPVFNKDGAIGSMFKADGAIGGTAEKVGGPFSKDGAIGKNFNADGAIGGTVHENLGKGE